MQVIYKHERTEDADFTLNSILEISSEGFWDWNALTGHVERSHSWFRMLGYDISLFKKDVFTWENVIHPDDYSRVMEYFERYINGEIEEYKIQYRCKRFDDTYLWIEDSGRVVQKTDDGKVSRMIGAHTNIDEIKNLQNNFIEQDNPFLRDKITFENIVDERVRELSKRNSELNEKIKLVEHNASHDSLTSLYNRRMFESLFTKEIHRAKRYSYPLSIVLFDIDDFKKFNDTYGHTIGDEILVDIAVITQSNVRDSDVISRWGGEEFIIIFPESDLEETTKKADILKNVISNKVFSNSLHITCSFGVTSYIDNDTEESFFQRCDRALYKAKELGKNNVQTI